MSVSTNLLSANTSDVETDATGWTPGTNTTVGQSTRWYTGAHSLQMTATAAGSVTATTAVRIPVTAGSSYTAYAYVANGTAVAGRTATITVQWWASWTGGTAIATSSSAAVTLPNSTSWLTPPPILIATAPAGAAYATMLVSVSGMSAGGAVTADAMAFGPGNLISGNLLSYAVQSTEVDTSGWQASTNCTLARTSSVSYEGWWSLTVAATAAGDTQAKAASAVPVTAGLEYFSYAWVQPPASGIEFRQEIWWYDATGAVLTGGLATASTYPTSGTWTRCAVTGVAPVGAVSARTVLRPQAATAGQTWVVDQIALVVAPNTPGNLLTYNTSEFEVSTYGWTAKAGCTIARSTVRAYSGVGSMLITADGTTTATVELTFPVAITAGHAYQLGVSIYHDVATESVQLALTHEWADASGDVLRTDATQWDVGTAAGWYRAVSGAVAPAGAATVRAYLGLPGSSAGQTANVDTVVIAPGGLAVTPQPIAGYGVQLSVQGLTTGTPTTWGLWRVGIDGSLIPVRGSGGDMDAVTVTGDLAVAEDYEAPLGVMVSYYARTWSTTANASFSSDGVVIPAPDGDSTLVLKDPAGPARTTTITVETVPDWTEAARQGNYSARGRQLPIVVSDVRSGRTGTLMATSETDDERTALWWLLNAGSTLLLQWPTGWGLDDMYVQVGDVVEARLSPFAAQPDREWTLPLIEVDRPVGGLVGSANRTWQDVLSGYADWYGVLTGNRTWLDVLTGVVGS